jgi:hypothetical protein
MGRGLNKEKLGLPSFERLIQYQESQVMNCIRIEALPSMPKTNEEKAVIETSKKLIDLRTKSLPRQTNFQQLAR